MLLVYGNANYGITATRARGNRALLARYRFIVQTCDSAARPMYLASPQLSGYATSE